MEYFVRAECKGSISYNIPITEARSTKHAAVKALKTIQGEHILTAKLYVFKLDDPVKFEVDVEMSLQEVK